MPALPDGLRKLLATAIRDARRVAESGARKALEALAVPRPQFHDSMTVEEQALRRRLRAHGRQLGDVRDRNGAQEIGRLAHEVAYEHWHRMLFARFLAENHLLIEPDSGVAISMAECEELARDQGADPWALAARFAQCMLPRIFRPDDPALAVTLAPETRQALERLLAFLPAAVFTADDALGWTYQFWQAEKKEEVNASGVKIGADELPAVTQLFTEGYMVLFLFHNTIGAWRAGRLLADRPALAQGAGSEAELREAVRLGALGGYDFAYLRFVREPREGDEAGKPSGPWRPAAGTFPGWPKRAAELRVLDPCCGSGHFLVEGLQLLARLRMEEGGLDLEDAIRAVVAENLFGLEIDHRCTQIAAFNVALAAWKLAGRPIELPPLHIACSGLAVGSTKSEWLALAGDDQRLRGGMERLYAIFEKAPTLGSLIDPLGLTADLLQADFAVLRSLLASPPQGWSGDDERTERAVAAHGMVRAAELLADQYTVVITNVPYLGRREQGELLKAFADMHHDEARQNLATTFIGRAFGWISSAGTMAIVCPQNWLFLTSYTMFRRRILTCYTLNAAALLGSNAFREMNWWAATTSLVIISSTPPGDDSRLLGLDVGADKSIVHKADFLATSRQPTVSSVSSHDGFSRHAMLGPFHVLQSAQRINPDQRIVVDPTPRRELLSDHAVSHHGLTTGDSERMQLRFWELRSIGGVWMRCSGSIEQTALFDGLHHVLRWENGTGAIDELLGARKDGRAAWRKMGVLVRPMRHLPAALYMGDAFDINTAVVVPHAEEDLAGIWSFVRSEEFRKAVRRLDQKLNVTSGTLVKVDYDALAWRARGSVEYPRGLPEPESDDPTQWIFHGHPARTWPASALQIAVARLLGYRWPPEHDPDVRLAAEARAWVQRTRHLDGFADGDGIACLAALHGKVAAADRLRGLLATAFGDHWSSRKERELLSGAAGDGKPAASLEEWLRDHFFEEHCRLFHQRPFIWHVWDGRRDGFHALVNYHCLAGPSEEGRRMLQALAYSYLGDWIERQKAEQREGREGADGRLAAALDLQAQLERILAGEPPCDIFVRWKPLHQQSIGWEPDINDGVRLNIRPFLSAELRVGGRKGAGILRWKPAIDWRKDRGKEPQDLRPKAGFPWFWECPGGGPLDQRTDFSGGHAFDGNRWNDLHCTNVTKRAARERAQENGRG